MIRLLRADGMPPTFSTVSVISRPLSHARRESALPPTSDISMHRNEWPIRAKN